MITFHDIEQGSPEWLELRQNLYTGMNADKLLSYHGQVKIVNGVTSAYAISEITGFPGNFYTKRGHILEDQAIELYQKITGRVGIRHINGNKIGFVTNTKYPNCGYSPDDIYPDRTIECKAFNKTKHLKMYNGDISLKVLAQCYFGMLICNVRLCDLLIYNPDFAKRDDPDYNPQLALKIITIRWRPSIAANFRRILLPAKGLA